MRLAPIALAGAAFLAVAAAARPLAYAPAPEQIPAELRRPGAELVTSHCAACHSLDYIATQPRGKGAQFWKDTVAKMINVYGASIPAADAEAISETLAKTYGEPR